MPRWLGVEGIPALPARVYARFAARCSIMQSIYRDVAEEVAAAVSTGTALDVGTGPGYLPLALARRAPGLRVVGLDITPTMVKIARREAHRAGLAERALFVAGDAAALPFADASLDLAISTESLHHWSRPAQALSEILRVLQPEGEAWIYDLRRDVTPEGRAEVRRRYGRLLAFLFLTVVRFHSSISTREVEQIIATLGPIQAEVEDRGPFLLLRLRK